MLRASEQHIQAELVVKLQAVREKEFDFFLQNLTSMAQVATLISGFCHSGLLFTKFIDRDLCGKQELVCAEITYPLAITISIGLSLLTQWRCLLIMLLAPGYVLHGGHNALAKCVHRLKHEILLVLALLGGAIGFFLIGGALWAFQSQRIHRAILITSLVCLTIVLLYATIMYLQEKFNIRPAELETGSFCREVSRAAYRPRRSRWSYAQLHGETTTDQEQPTEEMAMLRDASLPGREVAHRLQPPPLPLATIGKAARRLIRRSSRIVERSRHHWTTR